VVASEGALGAMTGSEFVDAGGNADCELFRPLRFANDSAGDVVNGNVDSGAGGSPLATGARPPAFANVLGWKEVFCDKLEISWNCAVLVGNEKFGMMPFPTPAPEDNEPLLAAPKGGE
jgi:hypothetical protein